MRVFSQSTEWQSWFWGKEGWKSLAPTLLFYSNDYLVSHPCHSPALGVILSKGLYLRRTHILLKLKMIFPFLYWHHLRIHGKELRNPRDNVLSPDPSASSGEVQGVRGDGRKWQADTERGGARINVNQFLCGNYSRTSVLCTRKFHHWRDNNSKAVVDPEIRAFFILSCCHLSIWLWGCHRWEERLREC